MGSSAIPVIDRIVATRAAVTAIESADRASRDVREVIEFIRVAYHRDWTRQKLTFAREFLSRTWAGIPLPVLSVCGRGTQEIRYSTYLAYFLDGSKPHGLGARYLDALLAFMKITGIETYQAIVETEKWIGQIPGKSKPVDCYCDVVITCGDHVVFIENKVKSGESANPNSEATQLRRYDEAIRGNPFFANKELARIFLTPSGRESSRSPNWRGVSYGDLIEVGVGVLRDGGLSSTARENLKRFLIDLSLGPLDRAEDEIQTMVELAQAATSSGAHFTDRLHFDQAVGRNSMLVNLLMEG